MATSKVPPRAPTPGTPLPINTQGTESGRLPNPIPKQVEEEKPNPILRIAQVSRNGERTHFPLRAHPNDAGLDLFTVEESYITHGAITQFRTGVAVDIPSGYVGLICPRSGLAIGGITIVNAPGIIDAGYHGEINVITTSVIRGVQDSIIPAGTKIAQLVLLPLAALSEVQCIQEDFPPSERGAKGFGSSGNYAKQSLGEDTNPDEVERG
jgi:dUTP pyrophosphatase